MGSTPSASRPPSKSGETPSILSRTLPPQRLYDLCVTRVRYRAGWAEDSVWRDGPVGVWKFGGCRQWNSNKAGGESQWLRSEGVIERERLVSGIAVMELLPAIKCRCGR